MILRAILVAGLGLLGACQASGPSHTVIPQAPSAPSLDGPAVGGAWANALVLTDITKQQTFEPPAKSIQARMLYDPEALYVAVICDEPDPSKLQASIRKENQQVWMDDSVELFFRRWGDEIDYRQFIVNPAGTRGWYLVGEGGDGWKPKFRVKSELTGGKWVCRFAIPWSDLGMEAPHSGDLIEMKFGRSDHTRGGEPLFYSWPAGSKYAGSEDYATVYFDKANLLVNPTLAKADGRIEGWDRRCLGHLAQHVSLQPNRTYRLSAMTRGTGGLFMGVVTDLPQPGTGHRIHSRPSEGFVPTQLTFSTRTGGETVVQLQGAAVSAGEVEVKDLELVAQNGYPSVGPAIPLEVDAKAPTVVKKLRVTDCRAVRGFVGSPTDGTTQSWGWDGQFTEHNRHDGGQGVNYFYRANDGLHMKLADDKGFNAIVVRGGVKADVYRDSQAYDAPDGQLLGKMTGKTRDTTRMWFDKPVPTDRVSFWNATDGFLSDVTFLRVERGDAARGEGVPPLRPAGVLPASSSSSNSAERQATSPQQGARIGSLVIGDAVGTSDQPPFFAKRFRNEQQAWKLTQEGKWSPQLPFSDNRGAESLRPPIGKFMHVIAPPLKAELCLSAIGLEFDVDAPVEFSARVQDPIDPRRELYGADFSVAKAGKVQVVLDFPDQVLPAGSQVWISLRFDSAATLRNPRVNLHVVDRKTAEPEAFAYRKYLLRGLYSAMSEARPWNGWYYRDKVAEFLASNSPYAGPCQEILCALDHCRYLGVADDDVRQYYEWIWRGVLCKEGKTPPFTTKLDVVEGAPKWASLAHRAWMQARKVPQWWLDNRLVPTGEFGGVVGDDSDMFQNYADFPMLEDGKLAADLKDAALRLQALAEATTMIEGVNRVTMDPLHAYEEGLNHEALSAFWSYGDPVYLENCMAAARSLEKLTVVTPKGHRHFRSQNIGHAKIDDATTDRDGGAHVLMWHPVFELVRYNGNPLATKWLKEWGDGWLAHMAPGAYATEVDVAKETVTESSKHPFNGIYGGQGAGMQSLYLAIGDRRYIQAYMDDLAVPQERLGVAPGGIVSDLYLSGAMDGFKGDLKSVLAHDGYALAAATGNKDKLCEELTNSITELQRYPMMYTYVECFTDRVFMGEPMSIVTKCYTGGFATRNKFSRTHAVSYEGFGTDYAALVLSARPDKFKVLLYNFADKELTGKIRFWTLGHGNYRLTVGVDADGNDQADAATRDEKVEVQRGTRVDVTLPSRKVLVLELAQTEKLDDITPRADLALSRLDCVYDGKSVTGVAHNIGAKDVADVVVTLVDADGKVKEKKALGSLAAPSDLLPKRVAFAFENLPPEAKDWFLVLDSANAVPEINKYNNRLPLKDAKGTPKAADLGGPGSTVKQP